LLRSVETGETDGSAVPIRRLIPASGDALPLHVTTPGARLSVKSKRLVVTEPDADEPTIVCLKDVSQVELYGGVQITTQAIQRLLGDGISIGYFSSGGWFYGLSSPIGHSSVQVRRRQYARSVDDGWCLRLARDLVRSKIRNSRTMLRRNHRDAPETTLQTLKTLADRALEMTSLGELRGIEGLAAREYFAQLPSLLRPKDDGCRTFDFDGRNRRPPRDPVNAMLSMAYTLLVRHFTAACAMVGLDPHVGFFHADRPGRPSLALDLMEPFRPLLADSAVVTAVNNGEVCAKDFITVGDSCCFTTKGRRSFIKGFERRLDVLVRHPVFGYRISYRKVIEVQTRLLARQVLGELHEYPTFETR
jgi:CRISPR-associated protein Cas1